MIDEIKLTAGNGKVCSLKREDQWIVFYLGTRNISSIEFEGLFAFNINNNDTVSRLLFVEDCNSFLDLDACDIQILDAIILMEKYVCL